MSSPILIFQLSHDSKRLALSGKLLESTAIDGLKLESVSMEDFMGLFATWHLKQTYQDMTPPPPPPPLPQDSSFATLMHKCPSRLLTLEAS